MYQLKYVYKGNRKHMWLKH